MTENDEGSLAVLDELGFQRAAPKKKPKDKKDVQPTDGREPPKKGTCKRCGREERINRLKLCYRCYVITNLEDAAKAAGEKWSAGDPHPDWCACALAEHRTDTGEANQWN